MAQVAGLAIRAGFSAMIMPNTAADQRKYEQKCGQYGAEPNRSNCALLLHSSIMMPSPRAALLTGAQGKRTFSVLQTRPRRKRLQHNGYNIRVNNPLRRLLQRAFH